MLENAYADIKRNAQKSNGLHSPEEKTKGEFDDLISALRTGDVFGEDMAKIKRNRKRVSSGVSPPRINGAVEVNGRERSGPRP